MQEQQNNTKKPYEKPEAKRFSLRPEEAVLGNCKTSAVSAGSSSTCKPLTGCSSPGS